MSLVVNRLTKRYGSQLALDDVSFSISKGEITGVIGPNGAGKSTLFKIITGYIPADEGEVIINGINIKENALEIKKITGYLPENNPLYGELYVREYLLHVAGFYNIPNPGERIEKLIIDTGLAPECHKRISQLSKGYRQRVGIAQALIHDPDVLILDESTSGLDPNQVIEIRNLISQAGKEKVVLLSTHILSEVEAICSRVIVIRNGKIVAEGKPGEIGSAIEQTITVIVEFDREPSEQRLSLVPGTKKIARIGNGKFLVESDSNADIRPLIFSFAVNEGIAVLSMSRKEKSLEDVFAELTR